MTTSTENVTAKAKLVEILPAEDLPIGRIEAAFKATYPRVKPWHKEDREGEYATDWSSGCA